MVLILETRIDHVNVVFLVAAQKTKCPVCFRVYCRAWESWGITLQAVLSHFKPFPGSTPQVAAYCRKHLHGDGASRSGRGKCAMSSNLNRWFTEREAAAYARVSPRTIWSWAASGKITRGKVGAVVRYCRESIDELLESSGKASVESTSTAVGGDHE